MTTAILYDPHEALHAEPGHPESPYRLTPLRAALAAVLARPAFAMLQFTPADERLVRAVHTQAMLERTQMLAYEGGGFHDGDTYVSPDSWAAALVAAGAAVRLTEAVVRGTATNGFAIVRPPGHHATPTRAMGFCLVNNVAVAARYAIAQLGLRRVAIIDWDVHHGNGTQDIFEADGDVLYCSTHNYPFYPGTGHWREMGSGPGFGATLNVPLPLGTGDTTFVRAYDDIIIPAIHRFAPDLILVSAGYDAHHRDPLGGMNISSTAYATVGRAVYNLAQSTCGGRVAAVLEGGYDSLALAECALATLGIWAQQPDLINDTLGPGDDQPVAFDSLIRELRVSHPLFQ